MHVGNVVVEDSTGEVKIIDWELSVAHEPPFDPRKAKRNSNPMINDQGTQCDSLFPKCTCQWPWHAVLPGQGPPASATPSCTLFGLNKTSSQRMLASMTGIGSWGGKYLGPSAELVRPLLRGGGHDEL
mmetsp:Transcript_11645/g.25939  ORF Transcript_11645/g.25939 Transcript_11645/m.25939 type:complete len:128 (+) Transcript_11645:78-461(+)